MRYPLRFYDFILEGYFFYDKDFGSFFITSPSEVRIASEKRIGIHLTEEGSLEMSLDDTGEYRLYGIHIDKEYQYIFMDMKVNQRTEFQYHTLEDLYAMKGFESAINSLLAKILRLANGNYVISNVQDYITVIEELKKKYDQKETFYRGQYSSLYELVPSLYRKKNYYENESYMYMDFKTQFYNELSSKKYIEILTTMQHYKMPTRLLDTTSNPLVALYMATDATGVKEKGNPMGEVVVMNEDIRNVKYADSNAVVLLSSLAVLETNYKQELYLKIKESIEKNDPSIYRESIGYKRFVAEVLNELPSFDESFFKPEVLLRPRHVKVGMINERIIAQSGSFILFGLCNYVTGESYPLSTVTKERVFVVNKEHIQSQLSMLNIHSGSMYPDKDHISTSIIKSYDK